MSDNPLDREGVPVHRPGVGATVNPNATAGAGRGMPLSPHANDAPGANTGSGMQVPSTSPPQFDPGVPAPSLPQWRHITPRPFDVDVLVREINKGINVNLWLQGGCVVIRFRQGKLESFVSGIANYGTDYENGVNDLYDPTDTELITA